MNMPQDQEKQKPRQSDAQKIYNEADNARRFAGDDADAKASKQQAEENIRQDTDSIGKGNNSKDQSDYTDVLARRDEVQAHDYKGEAQNVNDDKGRPMTDVEAAKATNKATEGIQQGRDGIK